MKTYSPAIENHMVIGGFCDSYARRQRDPHLTCAACLSDPEPDRMQYMADVGNYICHDCMEYYAEVREYIKPLRWWEE
jgi:hypothetical protein